ncbi:MAG: HlyC/CorC family transporter [Bacilli bacterium]|nr:HlyC/CorC family transporter [Bacilli bacterium]
MNDVPPWLCIVIIVVLVILSAFFSSTETAFAALNVFKIKVKADDGNKTAKLILKTREKFNTTLVMALVGYNIDSIVISTLSSIMFFSLFKGIMEETFISLISTAIMTFIVYIFCDMVPKMIAKAMPEAVARNNVYLAQVFKIIFFPIIMLFNGIIKLVELIFKVDKQVTLTEEDFTNIVEDIEEKGLIEDNESDIIYNSLEFTDTAVRDVLTKRNRMFVIDLQEMSREEINKAILSTKYSRIPVIYGNLDKVVGILVVKKYINAYLRNNNVSIVSVLQKPYFVDTKIKMDEMIDGFKKHHTHMAIVKHDDKVLGLITMEDVLEELVGKIAEPQGESK